MKRVKSACICQTLNFCAKDDVEKTYAARLIKEEVNQYKKRMDLNGTKYKIVEEKENEDGSVEIKIIKQYNQSPVGEYLN